MTDVRGAPGRRLLLHGEVFGVARLQSTDAVPEWAEAAVFCSVTRTAEELSVVVPEARIPADVRHESGLRCFEVRGPLSFSEVGVVASLAAPLADAGVSILTIATFDTDYVFVPAGDLERAIHALRLAGHEVSA